MDVELLLEKLQIAEERIEVLEEQIKMAKMEATEQRARADAAESWLKIKSRKITLMSDTMEPLPPAPPKGSVSWDDYDPEIKGLTPKRRPTEEFPEIRRSSEITPKRRPTEEFPEIKETRRSSELTPKRRPTEEFPEIKRTHSCQSLWPVIQVPSISVEVVTAKSHAQLVKAVKSYEGLFLSRKENPLWNKEILCEHAINLGIPIHSKTKDHLLEDMRHAIDDGKSANNPTYILHLYEKRLSDVSLSDLNKETIEEHCRYYGIFTDGKRKSKLWDELREFIKCK
jgi:hypothetical protein